MEEQRIIILNKYEYGLMINALNEFRTKLIKEKKSTELVNELLLRLLSLLMNMIIILLYLWWFLYLLFFIITTTKIILIINFINLMINCIN